ncbi:MAG: fibronectin type III domain-containing protein [Saprospiraceae bacterium]
MSSKIHWAIICLLFCLPAHSQKISDLDRSSIPSLFTKLSQEKRKGSSQDYEMVQLNHKELDPLKEKFLKINYLDAEFILQLEPYQLFSDRFLVQNESGKALNIAKAPSVFSGTVLNHPNSFCVVSVSEASINGFIEIPEKGTLVIEPIQINKTAADHFIYYTEELDASSGFGEGDYLIPANKPSVKIPQIKKLPVGNTPVVQVHFVADHDLYLNKGSVQNTVNYISGFFAAVAALYERAGMYLQMSGITVFQNPDGFPETESDEILSHLRTNFTAPNGDLTHLVALDEGNGGIAYLDVLCNEDYRYGYSDIATGYNAFSIEDDPSNWLYSWTVGVVAHELGHNIGAPHTHDCFWTIDNVANQAIDNCGFLAEGIASDCGGTLPVNGGTIMSYCNQIGNVGINFTRGFHPLVQNVLFNAVQSANCLSSIIINTCEDGIQNGEETGIDCGGSQCQPCAVSCAAPQNVTISIDEDRFSVGWSDLLNAEDYNIRVRPKDSVAWDIANNFANGFTYFELASCSLYEFQIQSNCSNGSFSDWSVLFEVTTSGCPTCMDGIQNGEETGIDCGGSNCGPCEEECNPPMTPQITTTDSSIYLLWAIPDNAQNFDVRARKKGNITWIYGNGLDNDANLNGLQKCTEYEFQIRSNCTSTSSIWSGTYIGKTSGCTPCSPVVATFSSVTDSTASVNWLNPERATEYNVRIREKDSTEYLYGYGFGAGFNVYDLYPCTTYEYQIQSICEGELSPWSRTFTLRTSGCFTCEDGIQNGDETGIDCGGSWCSPCLTCEPPQNIEFTAGENQLVIHWNELEGDNTFNIRYQQVGATNWNLIGNVDPETVIDNLSTCTEYQFQIQSTCESLTSDWSQTFFISTLPELPEFTAIPSDTSMTCTELQNYVLPALAFSNGMDGNCKMDGMVNGTIMDDNISECGGTAQAIWTYLDPYERVLTYSQDITLAPAPIADWINPPAPDTLTCEEAANYSIPDLVYTNSELGICLIEGSVAGSIQSGSFGLCGDSLVIGWTFTDNCGRSILHQQTIHIKQDSSICDPCPDCPTPVINDFLVGNNHVFLLTTSDDLVDSIFLTLIRDSAEIDRFGLGVNEPILIEELSNCQNYSMVMEGVCSFGKSAPTDTLNFQTLGCESTSRNEILKLPIAIYPNPFDNFVILENSSEESTILEVISSLGQVLIRTSLTTGTNRIDISGIPPGILFFRMHNSKGMETRKLIKTKGSH